MLEGLLTLVGAAGIIIGLVYSISAMTAEVSPLTGAAILVAGVAVTLLAWFMMSRQNTAHSESHGH